MTGKRFISVLAERSQLKSLLFYGRDSNNNKGAKKSALQQMYKMQKVGATRTLYWHEMLFNNTINNVRNNVIEQYFFNVKGLDPKSVSQKKLNNIIYGKGARWDNILYASCGREIKSGFKATELDKYLEEYVDVLKNVNTDDLLYSETHNKDDGSRSRFIRLLNEREVIQQVDTKNRQIMFCNNPLSQLTSEEIKQLYEFLLEASQIAPLYPLGYFLLQNGQFDKFRAQNNHAFFLMYHVSPDYALAQECVFRCLKALFLKKKLKIDGKLYIPLKVFFGRKSPQYAYTPYLGAIQAEGHIHCEIDLTRITVITLDKKVTDAEKNMQMPLKREESTFTVKFFIDAEKMAYLQNQVLRNPDCSTFRPESPVRSVTIDSPYEDGPLEATIHSARFHVRTRNRNEFFEWIRGFGEFAGKVTDDGESGFDGFCRESESVRAEASKTGRQLDLCFEDSLCQPYNSIVMKNMLEKEDGDFVKKLPPTNLEIFWLQFVLKNYPNLSRLFLDDSTLTHISAIVKNYVYESHNSAKHAFNPFAVDEKVFSPLVYDLPNAALETLRKFKQYIKDAQPVTYRKFDEKGSDVEYRIFPYAFTYSEREGSNQRDRVGDVSIMAYSLTEQRIIVIRPDTLENLSKPIQKTDLNEKEKLYLAFARCEKEENREETLKKISSDTFWFDEKKNETETAAGDEAAEPELKAKKKNLYLWIEKNSSSTLDECTARFLYYYDAADKMVVSFFHYYYELLKDGGKLFKTRTQQEGALPFTRQELIRKTNILFLLYAYHQEKEKSKWDTVVNDPQHAKYKSILTNIVLQQAEQDKLCKVTFCLKKEALEQKAKTDILDRIFELVAPYNCVIDTRNDEMNFTLAYDRFEFRKIHRILLGFSDIIKVTGPAETKTLIEKRLDNRKKMNFCT